ncbi:hypothetical protein CDSM653_02349 [Caldanaerobacter subterraneus subsp. pacificus DSM 12653]|uniref:Uncharacterized protein n=1 Tax=Caldanaerobacter subterraneus subsp. pacificus DSM 12653 TaxID=391606 RepID=A0A0F5PJU3_9THEO|nr:hypothetical protein CDSM653_02392 [Caldanaerobacter subterraneus subsp. pacificus DSM 12653]KKC28661.1 hypothetical protein CDSM653_02349 [Caldanaerobacter subterraneus subsp. pacificus DSM 12653]
MKKLKKFIYHFKFLAYLRGIETMERRNIIKPLNGCF